MLFKLIFCFLNFNQFLTCLWLLLDSIFFIFFLIFYFYLVSAVILHPCCYAKKNTVVKRADFFFFFFFSKKNNNNSRHDFFTFSVFVFSSSQSSAMTAGAWLLWISILKVKRIKVHFTSFHNSCQSTIV